MLHLHLGKNRTTKTIALTTAGLATAGLLAAAVALLPLGASADEPATPLALTSEQAESTAAPRVEPTPAPPATTAPTDAEASAAVPSVPEATEQPGVVSETGAEETAVPEATEPDTSVPGDGTLTPRESWLVQQQLVRECMAAEGQEYLYFEWWNPVYAPTDASNPSPPGQPAGLTTAQIEAWSFALDGDTGGGADYHWQDAGCWGAIVEQLGRTS